MIFFFLYTSNSLFLLADVASKNSDVLSAKAPASLNSKDASVDDAEFVNAFIKGF